MPEPIATSTEKKPETGADAAGGGSEGAPAFVTKADFEAWTSKFASTINGEMARHRKALSGETPKGPEPKASTEGKEGAQPAGLTYEDLGAFKEVGRLEAKIGDRRLAALMEDEDYAKASPREQLRTLRLLSKGLEVDGGETPIEGSRGETPAATPKNPRLEAPRPRDGVPRPKTKREYFAMKPEQRKVLRDDPTFDPTTLAP